MLAVGVAENDVRRLDRRRVVCRARARIFVFILPWLPFRVRDISENALYDADCDTVARVVPPMYCTVDAAFITP